MSGGAFVELIHIEPAECRRDLDSPTWDVVASLVATLGTGPERRLELYGSDLDSVMTVEGHGEAFHVSIQIGEVRYECFQGSIASADAVAEVGPFAFWGDGGLPGPSCVAAGGTRVLAVRRAMGLVVDVV